LSPSKPTADRTPATLHIPFGRAKDAAAFDFFAHDPLQKIDPIFADADLGSRLLAKPDVESPRGFRAGDFRLRDQVTTAKNKTRFKV
jgi:hypothetical protein